MCRETRRSLPSQPGCASSGLVTWLGRAGQGPGAQPTLRARGGHPEQRHLQLPLRAWAVGAAHKCCLRAAGGAHLGARCGGPGAAHLQEPPVRTSTASSSGSQQALLSCLIQAACSSGSNQQSCVSTEAFPALVLPTNDQGNPRGTLGFLHSHF